MQTQKQTQIPINLKKIDAHKTANLQTHEFLDLTLRLLINISQIRTFFNRPNPPDNRQCTRDIQESSIPKQVRRSFRKLSADSGSNSPNRSYCRSLRKTIMKLSRRRPGLKVQSILSTASGWFDWTIWKPVFNILDEVPVQRIYFTNYRNPNILYDIVHISFPKLRELHFQDNLITSIQPLAAINIPNLRKLDLRRNLITSIQCLNRCQFPRLQQINLSDNLILSCKQIAECYFPELHKIVIQEKTYLNIYMIYQGIFLLFSMKIEGRGQKQLKSTSRVNGYDLRWILKLQTKSVEFIKYSADARIIRKQIEEHIGAKYYKIRVQKKGMEKGSLLPLMSF